MPEVSAFARGLIMPEVSAFVRGLIMPAITWLSPGSLRPLSLHLAVRDCLVRFLQPAFAWLTPCSPRPLSSQRAACDHLACSVRPAPNSSHPAACDRLPRTLLPATLSAGPLSVMPWASSVTVPMRRGHRPSRCRFGVALRVNFSSSRHEFASLFGACRAVVLLAAGAPVQRRALHYRKLV